MMWRPRTLPNKSDFELLKEIKKEEHKFSHLKKNIEEEDSEFLDEFEKIRRNNYLNKKANIQEIINRRTKKWNQLERERMELGPYRFSQQTGEYDVEYYYEEVIKTEEVRTRLLIDN